MPTPLRQQKYAFGSLRKDPHWCVQGLKFYSQFKPAGKLIDESLYGNDGTIVGPTWIGDGLSFNGSSDYVDLGNDDSIDVDHDRSITVSFWMKPAVAMNSASGRIDIIARTDKWWFLYDFQDGKLSWVFTSGGYGPDYTVTFDADKWYHIAGTKDGNNNKVIYINGVPVLSEVDSGGTYVGTAPVYIGNSSGNSNWFNGIITDTMIYNRALSASEIAELYINSDLPMQQYPAWWGKAPAVGVNIPVMIHHYKQAGGL